jgi:uncharacterized protein (TIGR02001 family)
MKLSIGVMALAAVLVSPLVGAAQDAEWTANAGWVSQYYYRGIQQKSSSAGASSASAGLDATGESFSVGTWAADVGDGSEIDLYGSTGFDLNENVSISVGGTGYFYTGEFDSTYLEINLGLAMGPISIEYSIGDYKTEGYDFLGITVENEGFYATIGSSQYGDNDRLTYAESGYGFSAADLDFTISGIFNNAGASGQVDSYGLATSEFTLVFGLSKTFALN